MGWLTGYRYRQLLRANTSDLTETLTNIPLPVFGPVLTGLCQADLDDCVFTDTDGTTILDYYWESKSAAAPVGHVKIPTLTHGNAALHVGYLYYGNASATDQSDKEGTFSSCAARWDLAEASGTVYDSTANNHDGTGTDLTFAQTGKVGSGITFNGTTSLIDCGADWIGTGADSFSAWIYPTGWGEDDAGCILTNGKTRLTMTAATTNVSGARDNYGPYALSGILTLNAWSHLAVSCSSGSVWNFYINGELSGSANQSTSAAVNGSNVFIGNRATNDRTFAGTLDEIRHYAEVKPVSWFLAEYMAGANTLFTFVESESVLRVSGGQQKPPRGAILRVGHPMARGLEAAYLFNEGTGSTLFDYSRNGRNGTIVGATWTSTERGPALNFSGSGQYVDLGSPSLFGITATSAMTLTALVSSASTTQAAKVIAAASGAHTEWGLYHYTGDQLYAYTGGAFLPSNACFGLNVWRRVSMTSDGVKMRSYMDGVLVGGPSAVGTTTGATGVAIGRYGPNGSHYLNGDIAAVFIHSRALSAAEIAQLHARPYDMFAR